MEELPEDDAVGVCDGECRLVVLVVLVVVVPVEERSPELLSSTELPEVTVEAAVAAALELLACWALYSCAAIAATDPVRATAPTTIQFVAVEASLRPASRRLKSRFFIVTVSIDGARKSALKGPSD